MDYENEVMPWIECPNCNDKTIRRIGDNCITCRAIYLGNEKANIKNVDPGFVGNLRPIKAPEKFKV